MLFAGISVTLQYTWLLFGEKITDFAGIAANRDNPKYLQDVSGYS